jgi:hypothetical protein
MNFIGEIFEAAKANLSPEVVRKIEGHKTLLTMPLMKFDEFLSLRSRLQDSNHDLLVASDLIRDPQITDRVCYDLTFNFTLLLSNNQDISHCLRSYLSSASFSYCSRRSLNCTVLSIDTNKLWWSSKLQTYTSSTWRQQEGFINTLSYLEWTENVKLCSSSYIMQINHGL